MTFSPSAIGTGPSKRPRLHRLVSIVIVGVIAILGRGAGMQVVNIKMASLAPEGSAWHQVLQDIAQDWREISDNTVRLQIYAGGVLGDESDMVRKMRLNQVQAAALTAEGLSYIDKGIYGLSLPLLVDNYVELDWLRSQVEPELRRRYMEKGIIVLAWADVGWVYWFTREPVRTPDDLRQLRLFTWAGDPHSPRLWKTAGFHAVSLSAVDVLPGLQTGLIDAVDSTPLTVASFQWFGITKYMTDLPWAAMTGGLIITQQVWNRIPKGLQSKLREAVEKRAQRIKNDIRYTDNDAVAVMQEHGLEVIEITETEKAQWHQLIDQYSHLLKGTLVDSIMYDRVLALKDNMERSNLNRPQPN
ncbi:MAG: TRAP transporter substrate-binding protein DctP [Fidelibacterota bacterium]|nr:MAG: TRAP transporter substrate-binding protein DctP [Candidatus Neomarinimicrobiota bacterium]